jgi:uncharacterized protein
MAASTISTRLRLRVAPASRTARGAIVRHGDGWKVRVAAPPEHGKANEAVLALVAERLDLPRSSVSLVSGRSGREKIVELAGVDAAEVERRLTRAGR